MHNQFFQRPNNLASIRFVSSLVSVNPINSTTYFDPCDCISPIITQESQQMPYIFCLCVRFRFFSTQETTVSLRSSRWAGRSRWDPKKRTLNDLFM